MAIRLYWWHEKRLSKLENYGDLLSQYLAEKISNQKVIAIEHPSKGFQKYLYKHYITIGSIISSATKKSIIWGSGIIKKNDNIRRAKFLAVRGPRTRQRILDLGLDCPEVYGDPGILLPDFYENKLIKKKFKIGVIPHYIDFIKVNEKLKNDKRIKVINLLTDNIEKTTDEILECQNIISSSLHGLIIPQTYRIPSLWVKFSNNLSGDNIKFYDYFESMDINFFTENFMNIEDLKFELLFKKLEENKSILLQEKAILDHRKMLLLKNCPFYK